MIERSFILRSMLKVAPFAAVAQFGERNQAGSSTSACGLSEVRHAGYGNVADLRRSEEAGFNHHLVKPDDFIKVKEVAGVFGFATGAQVQLRSSAKNYISNTTLAASGSLTAPGTLLGNARIRSLVHHEGVPGTSNATYKAYLFDIVMSKGKNFRDVKSLYHNGTKKDKISG